MVLRKKTFVRFLGGDREEPVEVKDRSLTGLHIPPGTVSFKFYDLIEGTAKYEGPELQMVCTEP